LLNQLQHSEQTDSPSFTSKAVSSPHGRWRARVPSLLIAQHHSVESFPDDGPRRLRNLSRDTIFSLSIGEDRLADLFFPLSLKGLPKIRNYLL